MVWCPWPWPKVVGSWVALSPGHFHQMRTVVRLQCWGRDMQTDRQTDGPAADFINMWQPTWITHKRCFWHTCNMQQLRSSASKRVCLILGRPFVKRICYRTVVCLSVLFVYDVGVLWPNGWMDQDSTWYGGRPRPNRYCVRWGPSSPHGKGSRTRPHFSANVYCSQTVAHLNNCWALVACSHSEVVIFIFMLQDHRRTSC